jgi:hypothetical protein
LNPLRAGPAPARLKKNQGVGIAALSVSTENEEALARRLSQTAQARPKHLLGRAFFLRRRQICVVDKAGARRRRRKPEAAPRRAQNALDEEIILIY